MNKFVVNPETVFNSLQYGFSQAVATEGGRHVFISGQVGVDAKEHLVGADLASQMHAAFDNIEKVLNAIHGNLLHITMLRIFMLESERENQHHIKEALLNYFPSDPPATSWIFVSGLSRPEWLVEIEAQAILP